MAVYKEDLDYLEILESVAEELENGSKFYITDTEVIGTEEDNNLKLTGKLHIEDYEFNIIARYIIDADDTVSINVNIAYDSSKGYELSEADIKEIHDCTVWIKKLMKV